MSSQRAAEPSYTTPTREVPKATRSLEPVASTAIPPASSYTIAQATETVTEGALARIAIAEPEENLQETAPAAGPEMVPTPAPVEVQITPAAATDGDAIDVMRASVSKALEDGGHSTAAVLLEDGNWSIDGNNVRIEVGAKAAMIRITFNAAAEKLIRLGLSQASAPTRFLIVPREGGSSSAGPAPKVRAPHGSIENEARNHPLVLKAQELFKAEICSVVDLREK